MPEKSSSSAKVFYPKHNTAEVVDLLKTKLPGIQAIVPVKIFVLFGSYARGNYTVGSDVDVLMVYGGPPHDEVYLKIRGILNIPGLELHLYSQKEYLSLKPTIDRMIRGSISMIN